MKVSYCQQAKDDLRLLFHDCVEENIIVNGSASEVYKAIEGIRLEMYRLFTTFVQYVFAGKEYYVREYAPEEGGDFYTTRLDKNDLKWMNVCGTPNEYYLAELPWSFHFKKSKTNEIIRIIFLKDFFQLIDEAEKTLDLEYGDDPTIQEEMLSQKVADVLFDEYFGHDPCTFFIMFPAYLLDESNVKFFIEIKNILAKKTKRDCLFSLSEFLTHFQPDGGVLQIEKTWQTISDKALEITIEFQLLEADNLDIQLKGVNDTPVYETKIDTEQEKHYKEDRISPKMDRDEDRLQSLLIALETELRDLIELKLKDKFGPDWLDKIGPRWDKIIFEAKMRHEDEKRKRENPSDRLLDYFYLSHLYDLIFQYWGSVFSKIFNIQDIDYWRHSANIICDTRNPVDHARGNTLTKGETQIAEGYINQTLNMIRRAMNRK